MARTINCFTCGKMLVEIPNGGKVIKEGFRAYCLSCDGKEGWKESLGSSVPDFMKGIFGK